MILFVILLLLVIYILLSKPNKSKYSYKCFLLTLKKEKKRQSRFIKTHSSDIPFEIIYGPDTRTPSGAQKYENLIDDDYFKIFVEENSGSNPTTWLCPVSNLVLPEVTGDSKKIAIRITKHDTSRTICKVLDMPIISTSANIAGKEPATKQDELKFFFGDIDYIIEGEVGNNKKPSRIIDLISKEVIREGG